MIEMYSKRVDNPFELFNILKEVYTAKVRLENANKTFKDKNVL